MNDTLKQLDSLRILAWENKWVSKLGSNDRFTAGDPIPEKVFNLSFTTRTKIETLNAPTYSVAYSDSTRPRRHYLRVTFTNLNSLPHILSLINDPLRELIEAPDAVDNVDFSAELRQYEKTTKLPDSYPDCYAPLEKMVNTGWHFSDTLSHRGSSTPIRHGVLGRDTWHGQSVSYFPVSLPVLADFYADWLKIWEKFAVSCLEAYKKYPTQVVYRNIHGEIVPDLLKSRFMTPSSN